MRSRKAQEELAYIEALANDGLAPNLQKVAKRMRPALLMYAGSVGAGLQAYDELLQGSTFDRAGLLFELAGC